MHPRVHAHIRARAHAGGAEGDADMTDALVRACITVARLVVQHDAALRCHVLLESGVDGLLASAFKYAAPATRTVNNLPRINHLPV